jgi:hypothetical protein
MANAGGERGGNGDRDVDHLTPQFPIAIQKQSIENVSRMEGAMVAVN